MDKLSDSKNVFPTKVASSSPASKSTSTDHNFFVVSDHVMFYDKHKSIFRGTVGSVGPSFVGIEMDHDICLADFPDFINFQQQFSSKMSSKIFLPISSVRRDTSRNRRYSDNDVFDNSGDVQFLTKQDKDSTSQDIIVGSTVENIDQSNCINVLTTSSVELVDRNPYNLVVGSVIQYGEPVQCGVIKWIGNLPNKTDVFAGVEMDESVKGVASDGVWDGKGYFDCIVNRGVFVPLMDLKPHHEVKKSTNDALSLTSDHVNATVDHGSSQLPNSTSTLSSSPSPVWLPDQNVYNFKKGSKIQLCTPAVEYGVVKWIGFFSPENDWLHAGVEMENTVDNSTDGTFEGKPYFEAQPGKGKFVKVIELQPDDRDFSDTTVVTPNGEEHARMLAAEDGKRDGLLPISASQLDSNRDADSPMKLPESQHVSTELEVGTMIQFGNPVKYGVIKKIERTGGRERMAEVELENGKCKKVPLAKIQLDKRFIVDVNNIEGRVNPLEKERYKHDEKSPHIPPDKELNKHKHTSTKGIQGYKNSCYLDATLYGMFTFSDAFDVLLREEITANANELCLQKVLKSDIVYPLRKKGIVVQESIEEFRGQLAKLQNMKGLTSEEKDPEEFLNILFKHVLHLEPFVIIRRPSGIDREFLIQLFVEPDDDMPTVNTQRLLNKMFKEQNISFIKHPTRLLLQMPRYGRRFKSFQHIIPSLELDITHLVHNTGLCSICNQHDSSVCIDCSIGFKQLHYYCTKCSWRQHQINHEHKHDLSDVHTGRTLQLLSVLCIETSHYVCFTRITGSSGKDEWVFFDSMAERQDTGYNLPKVTHCTEPLKKFVYGKKDIGKVPSKQLPDLARRFVQDAYLCIYVEHDGVKRDGEMHQ